MNKHYEKNPEKISSDQNENIFIINDASGKLKDEIRREPWWNLVWR